MTEWLMLGFGLLLTIGTGLFVASEFALVNLDRSDLEARRDRGESRLGLTIAALKITSTHLSSAQLGITLTTLLTGYAMEPAISTLLFAPLTAVGLPVGTVPIVATTVAIVIATLLSMIVGELVPKNFALALPIQTAQLVEHKRHQQLTRSKNRSRHTRYVAALSSSRNVCGGECSRRIRAE